MEIPSNNTAITTTPTDAHNSLQTITLPDVQGKTTAQAIKILEEAGFKCDTNNADDVVVSEQVPKPGASLIRGSIIKLYSSSDTERFPVSVPNVKGNTPTKAKNILLNEKLNVKIVGPESGKVVSQEPIAETKVEEGSVVTITLQDELDSGSH